MVNLLCLIYLILINYLFKLSPRLGAPIFSNFILLVSSPRARSALNKPQTDGSRPASPAWRRLAWRLSLTLAGAQLANPAPATTAVEAGKRLSEPLVFVHLTDLHAATAEQNPPPRFPLDPHRKDLVNSFRWLQAAVDKINHRINPDFVVVTGDLLDASGSFPSDLYKVREILDQLDSPYHLTIGNHEARIADDFTRIFETPLNYTFKYGEWQFIALDGRSRDLSPTAISFLRNQLAASQAGNNPVIILQHWPLIIPDFLRRINQMTYDLQLYLRNAETVLAIIDDFPQVSMVLAGHIHQNTEVERRGVLHITTSSAIEPPHRFRVFRLWNETIESELRELTLEPIAD